MPIFFSSCSLRVVHLLSAVPPKRIDHFWHRRDLGVQESRLFHSRVRFSSAGRTIHLSHFHIDIDNWSHATQPNRQEAYHLFKWRARLMHAFCVQTCTSYPLLILSLMGSVLIEHAHIKPHKTVPRFPRWFSTSPPPNPSPFAPPPQPTPL